MATGEMLTSDAKVAPAAVGPDRPPGPPDTESTAPRAWSWVRDISQSLVLLLAVVPRVFVVRAVNDRLPGQPERVVQILAALFVVLLLIPPSVYLLRRRRYADPPSHITMVPPFSADGKKKPVYYFGRPNFGMALVKKGDDARIKELLRILNFFAAPFGSTEGHLLRYGVEGVDFNYDDKGNPQLTEQGKAEILAWGSLTSSTNTGGGGEVWYSPQEPQSVPIMQGYEKILGQLGVEDPSIGTFSQTFASKGTVLLESLGGGAQDIIAGRRPISDFDGLVQDWRAAGGNQIKEELAQSYAQLTRG